MSQTNSNSITTIVGDIVDQTYGYILHQCNCEGGFGGGVAGAIAKKYPIARYEYRDKHYGDGHRLGDFQVVEINDDLSIVNLLGQRIYRKSYHDPKKVFTVYGALEDAIKGFIKSLPPDDEKPIYIPYGIGCGLAGGDWDTVYKLIEKVSFEYSKPIVLVKLQP